VSEQLCVVYVTVGSEAEAAKLSNSLVSEHLAACVNRIGPIQSTYLWQGKVHNDPEYLLMIKTRKSLVDLLSLRVKELHSYDLPEVIALPIQGGLEDYLDWVRKETQISESS